MRLFLVMAIPLALAGCGADTSGIERGDGLSYAEDVFPAFERRNCVECHSGGGPGKDEGGLMLDSGATPVHRELTEEISPNHAQTRVRLDDPEASLLLTMPLGGGAHGAFFSGPSDPDYELFLAWIRGGAAKD